VTAPGTPVEPSLPIRVNSRGPAATKHPLAERAAIVVVEAPLAAGLWAVPYAFALPSFLREGYGRWGFFFASSHPIRDEELRTLQLPAGSGLTAAGILAGTRLPVAAIQAMDCAPNMASRLGSLGGRTASTQRCGPLPG